MRRGEIFHADLSPTVGSEVNKRRPVVIVSRDQSNRVASTVAMLPITSSIARVYPFETLLPAAQTGLPKDSKAQAQQIRTISKQRVTGRAQGRVSQTLTRRLEAAIRLHLALE